MTRVIIAAVAAAVVGLAGGLCVGRSGTGRRQADQTRTRWSASKLIAIWMLSLTTVVSAVTLYLMRLCIVRDFSGALYPLSALITLCQAGNAVVLAAYYSKSKAENTKGGIVYDAAFINVPDSGTDL